MQQVYGANCDINYSPFNLYDQYWQWKIENDDISKEPENAKS